MTEEDGCLQEVSYGATSTTTEPRVSSQFRFHDVLCTYNRTAPNWLTTFVILNRWEHDRKIKLNTLLKCWIVSASAACCDCGCLHV